MKCSPWQIWLAVVKFEESEEVKSRPVVIISTKRMIAFSLKMTSQAPRNGDYPLKKWKQAGLDRPTAVRFQQKLELSERDLMHQIGSVDLLDRLSIQKILDNI